MISSSAVHWPDIRLVEGNVPSEGRVQIRHNKHWYSVCTNTKNWTIADINVVCHELGFDGGLWYRWFPHRNDTRQLLYEAPRCLGYESSIQACPNWKLKRVGSGSCDYHADIGIRCSSKLYNAPNYWSGLRFLYATHSSILSSEQINQRVSNSLLRNVVVSYAGEDLKGVAVPAIYSIGVPPQLNRVEVKRSASTGLNISEPLESVSIEDSSFIENRGYGIFVNTSFGGVRLTNVRVKNNGADGIRFIIHEGIGAGASFSESSGLGPDQVYPVQLTHAQTSSYNAPNHLCRDFKISNYLKLRGYQLTAHFPYLMSEEFVGDTRKSHLSREGYVRVLEGYSDSLIMNFKVQNYSRPPSLTSKEGNLRICYIPSLLRKLTFNVIVVADMGRAYDLNVTDSHIQGNNGRGIWVENQRAGTVVNRTTIAGHSFVAGVHVASGTGDVIINDTKIYNNDGDGVNLTLSGGYKHIDRSQIRGNTGRGVAVWFNETSNYLSLTNENHVSYSIIVANNGTGLLMGNVCRSDCLWNISMNTFDNNIEDAIVFQSCWDPDYEKRTQLRISHNRFTNGRGLAINIAPAFHLHESRIEHNLFEQHQRGVLYINNWDYIHDDYRYQDIDVLLRIRENRFFRNRGIFVANIGLQEANDNQKLFFVKNVLKDNEINEPYKNLNPRSRVAAVVVISSSNCKVNLNNLINPNSRYELGSHLENHGRTINASKNFFGDGFRGDSALREIYKRIFDRKNRYNLAQIKFTRYRIQEYIYDNEEYLSSDKDKERDKFSPFIQGDLIGGEMAAEILHLDPKQYRVTEDILVKPGSRLILAGGTTLSFDQSIGMMVQGHLEFESRDLHRIKFTYSGHFRPPLSLSNDLSKPQRSPTFENISVPIQPAELNRTRPTRQANYPTISAVVRLSNGDQGRLEVNIDGRWGSVCSYGFDIVDASIACQQLGMVLNSRDWLLERNQFQDSVTMENVILSNLQCTRLDTDITECKAERKPDFEHSCISEVGIKCYLPSWSGLRFGMSAQATEIRHIDVEKAGLYDYTLNVFKPALQIDFNRHRLFNVHIQENSDSGLGIFSNDVFEKQKLEISNSNIKQNSHHGITVHSQGLSVVNCHIQQNGGSGIHYEPMVNRWEQMDLKSWITGKHSKYLRILPDNKTEIFLDPDMSDGHYVKITNKPTPLSAFPFQVKTRETYAIGVMILNPMFEGYTDKLIMYNKNQPDSPKYDLRTNSSHLPFWYLFEIAFNYEAGPMPRGDIILYFMVEKIIPNRFTDLSAQLEQRNRRIKTITIKDNLFKRNRYGFSSSHYNRDIGHDGNFYNRHSNETIIMVNNNFVENTQEAIFVDTPIYDPTDYSLAEINYTLINNKFTANNKGILHQDRNYRSSNNLFHWVLNGSSFENNENGGVIIRLPYVWKYNENFTHTVVIHNNSFRGNRNFEFVIDGYFARMNMSHNDFRDNFCRFGLVTIGGMEKRMLIEYNDFIYNTGRYVVEFNVQSHADKFGLVQAYFRYNKILDNKEKRMPKSLDRHKPTSYSVAIRGVQYINITRNLIRNPSLHFEFLAGVLTGSLQNRINLTENWWGTHNSSRIKERIFDFDDWNSYAIANFSPLLTSERFDSAITKADIRKEEINLDYPFGGRVNKTLYLRKRDKPYVISTDLTILPNNKLVIEAGVIIEFYPSVGILVLGDLLAYGTHKDWITLRPVNTSADVPLSSPSLPLPILSSSISSTLPFTGDRLRRDHNSNYKFSQPDKLSARLCLSESCDEWDNKHVKHHGFLQIFNQTIEQWVPVCDKKFSERNVHVVCSQLGYSRINNYFKRGRFLEEGKTFTSNVRYWSHQIQCTGIENDLTECEMRLNGYSNYTYPCGPKSDQFVYIYCGAKNKEVEDRYWGGIRFSIPNFEHQQGSRFELPSRTYNEPHSRIQYTRIFNAGMLHGEKNAAIQIIQRDVSLEFVTVLNSAHHAIEAVAPERHVIFHNLHLAENLGAGLNYLVLNGASTGLSTLPYTALKASTLPYNVFSFVDICDTNKNLEIDQRIIMYYKYDSRAVDCVKIIKSSTKSKKIAFRLLQFNLFNSSLDTAQPDFIQIYDGDIFNQTVKLIAEMGVTESHRREGAEKLYHKSTENSLSIRLHASGASEVHGFIAEITTSPISYFIDRGLSHNLTESLIVRNNLGGMIYQSVGETSPSVSISQSHFENNCLELYGNFTACSSAVYLHLQNTQHFYFRNNLIKNNDGGLRVEVYALNAAAALHAFIMNNLFVDNHKREALYIRGPDTGSIQIVIIRKNYFNQNHSPHRNNVYLSKIVFNFTENVMVRNYGRHQLAVIGFDMSYSHQTIHRNWFYNNLASHWEEKSTIFATNSGQRYIDNYLVNPENNFEMATINQSTTYDFSRSLVDASDNWWGFNETSAVAGRIRDANDSQYLISVRYMPYLSTNSTVLSGICSGGWKKIGDTCFLYFGARLSYMEAKHFCELQNSTMPVVKSHFSELTSYLYQWEESYNKLHNPVWVQSLGFLEKDCNVLRNERIESNECNQRLPFLCERAPLIKVSFAWPFGPFGLAILIISSLTATLAFLCLLCWTCKSRERHKEKLERHNSIRASIRSNRSLASSNSLNEIAYKRQIEKAMLMARQSHLEETTSNVNRGNGLANSSFKTDTNLTNDSYDSLSKNNCNYNDSDGSEEASSYTAHEPREMVFRQLEDRFAKDPGLENANVDYMLRPTFDFTIQNEGFKETSVSRNSGDISKEYQYNTGNSSPVNTISTVDTKRTEMSASPSPSLSYRNISSPHHYEEYRGGKSPSPASGLPPKKKPKDFNVKKNSSSSNSNHNHHPRPHQPPPKPPTHNIPNSFAYADSSSLNGAIHNGTMASLNDRPYLETCLDADNNYDYFQIHSKRYSPTASITTTSTNRNRPPLETAM